MIPKYDQHSLHLPAMASWPASFHLFDETQRNALRAAEASGRPLLVRGEPGTGKSQLAHAAAVASGRAFIPFVVDSRTEASDLMWRFDAIARLADAHLSAVPGADVPRGLSLRQYISPGPLWWGFDWDGASFQLSQSTASELHPGTPENWKPSDGCVVLLDEIDKAEAEVPNGLLEALGNGRFAVQPVQSLYVERAKSTPAPLVIVTTNDERELPAAFVRRCMVLSLALPKGDGLIDHLVRIGRLHGGAWSEENANTLTAAAMDLVSDRDAAIRAGIYAPGLAEYLDLLRALAALGGDPMDQLQRIRRFAYRKQPES